MARLLSARLNSDTLAKKLFGANFAEAEEFATSVMRQYVLGLPDSNMRQIVDSALKNWQARTVGIQLKTGENE